MTGLIFYRSVIEGAQTAPIDALIDALRAEGFAAYGAFAPSLKAAGVAGWLGQHLTQHPPVAILNATAFSARADDGSTPFDSADCPVYSPTGPYRVAMETLRGGLEPLGVSPSSILQVGGACRKT